MNACPWAILLEDSSIEALHDKALTASGSSYVPTF